MNIQIEKDVDMRTEQPKLQNYVPAQKQAFLVNGNYWNYISDLLTK